MNSRQWWHYHVQQGNATREFPQTPTSSHSMPWCPVNRAVLLLEVLCVTRSPPRVRHQSVCGGIGVCKPAKDVVIWGGCVVLGFPQGPHHVVGVCHHQLSSLQIATQHKRNFFHPCDYCSCLNCHLWERALFQPVSFDNLLSKVDGELLNMEWVASTRHVAKKKNFC